MRALITFLLIFPSVLILGQMELINNQERSLSIREIGGQVYRAYKQTTRKSHAVNTTLKQGIVNVWNDKLEFHFGTYCMTFLKEGNVWYSEEKGKVVSIIAEDGKLWIPISSSTTYIITPDVY